MFCINTSDYSAEIAPVGHTDAHAPQSIHSSALMSYFPSPSAMALTGHSPSQAPQLMHSVEITYAIIVTSLYSPNISLYRIIVIQNIMQYKFFLKTIKDWIALLQNQKKCIIIQTYFIKRRHWHGTDNERHDDW